MIEIVTPWIYEPDSFNHLKQIVLFFILTFILGAIPRLAS